MSLIPCIPESFCILLIKQARAMRGQRTYIVNNHPVFAMVQRKDAVVLAISLIPIKVFDLTTVPRVVQEVAKSSRECTFMSAVIYIFLRNGSV